VQLPLIFVFSLLVLFLRGEQKYCIPRRTFIFYGKLHKKDEIQLLGRFHRSEQMDFDSYTDHKIKSTLFSL